MNQSIRDVSEAEQEVLDELSEVFSNEVYEISEKLDWLDSDCLAEVFTSSGLLVATVNLTTCDYLLPPVAELCLLAYDLEEFNSWLYQKRRGW